MKNDLLYILAKGILLLILLSPVTIPVLAQAPGFFLDAWQEKSAEIPDYNIVTKPGYAASVEISVDMSEKLYKVPGYIYGNNAVCWGGNMNEHATVMTDIRNLNPHVLRWPGGNLSNEYFWNLTEDQRPDDIPAEMNPWYGVNDDNWQMSTDDYYDLLENTNSTGIICVNYSYARYGTGSDPVAKAAHMAAEWVRYDNGRSKFWEIGNENFGSWQAGYQIDLSNNQDGQPEFISGQLYGQHCRIFIDSMRTAAAEIGVDIKIGVVAYDAETSYDEIQTHWNEGMMPEVGDLADFMIVHSYFTPYDENSTVSTILNSNHVPEEIMSAMVSDMAEAGKPMIPVAFTEWNIFAVGSMQQVSYINGMHAALILGEFIQNDYGLATRWDLTNGWANGDDHGMFSRGGEPGVDLYNPRPVFFYMYYFQKFFGDRMVQSSVTGSSQVTAYASSFSSGEAGLVIINKGTSDEFVQVDFDHFNPGTRYYYYTLTGGDDNGDFSRKVYVNGYGTAEEGGGPDNYESIKASATEAAGGIDLHLPPLSVVYLMVDREPALTFLSSRVDTSASVVTVELSIPVILSDNPSGFEVVANGTTQVGVSGIEVNQGDSSMIHLLLDQELLPTDLLTISYSGSDVMSRDSIPLAPFSDMTVENLLPGAPPVLSDAYTTSDGQMIQLLFNMGMQITGPVADAFVLVSRGDPDQHIDIAAVQVDEADSTRIMITPVEPLYAEYDLELSYSGTGITSLDNTPLETFNDQAVTNNAPGLHPELVSAYVSDDGFSITLGFNKSLNLISPDDSLFTVSVDSSGYAIDTILAASPGLTIMLEDYIRFEDSVTISYNGTVVTSTDGGILQPIDQFPVSNNLPAPTIIDLPGIIDAALFSINRGMELQPCSDAGSGYNLSFIDPGDWVDYEVNVSETGHYSGNLRIAAPYYPSLLVIQTPDGDVVNQDTVAIPPTGGWQEWRNVPVEVMLSEGRQRIRLTALDDYFNINWLELDFDRTLQAQVISASTNERGDTILIVFDRELSEPIDGDQAAFTLLADDQEIAVTGLSLDHEFATTLLLSLENPLSAGHQHITVSYTDGTLRAADDFPVAFFTDVQVTNNVITAVEPENVPHILIYPNPFRDHITIESTGNQIVSVEVLDFTGKRLLFNHLGSPEHNIGLDLQVPSGMYLLRIRTEQGWYRSTMVAD